MLLKLSSSVYVALVHFLQSSIFYVKPKYFEVFWWLLKRHRVLQVNMCQTYADWTSFNMLSELQNRQNTGSHTKLKIVLSIFDNITKKSQPGLNTPYLDKVQLCAETLSPLRQKRFYRDLVLIIKQ